MNDGSVSVALWESAPACVAVQEHPMRTFDEARGSARTGVSRSR